MSENRLTPHAERQTNFRAMYSDRREMRRARFRFPFLIPHFQAREVRSVFFRQFFRQNFRRRNRKTAAVRFIFRVLDLLRLSVNFQKKSDKRAADKTRARADRICLFGFSASRQSVKPLADFFRVKTH